MKRLGALLGAVLLVVLAVGGIRQWSAPVDPVTPLARSAGPNDSTQGRTGPPPKAGSESPDGKREDVASGTEGESSELASDSIDLELELPRFRILGRVVDENRNPLAGISARLDGYCESWEEDHDPEAEGLSWWYEHRASEVLTAGDGTFELRGMLPPGYWIDIELEGPPYRGRVLREFTDDPDFERELSEGDNDLGTITLQPAGAITGVVLGPEREPLPGVYVRPDTRVWSDWIPGIDTDESGRFTVEHLLPASYEVLIEAKGFLDVRGDGIEVVEGTTTQVDFVLERAPTLSGSVVDDRGRPVWGARVRGCPEARREPDVHCRTEEDGTFQLELENRGAHFLHAGRVNLDDLGSRMVAIGRFEPDTSGIEVVLPALDEIHFEVVDARTDEPVEQFGLRVEACRVLADGRLDWRSVNESEVMEEIYLMLHDAGRAVKLVRSGVHAYAIQAPGYAPQREPLTQLPGSGEPQRIRLEPEARVCGRLELGGELVVGAAIKLSRQSFARDLRREVRDVHPGDDERGYDLDAFTGRSRETRSSGDGGFEVGELAAGTYCLGLKSEGSALRFLDELRIGPGEVLDLGTLQLVPGSVLRGAVLVAPGVLTEGLHATIEAIGGDYDQAPEYEWDRIPVRSDGSFETPALTPGTYEVLVDDSPGVVRDMEPVELEVRAGEDAELEIDLRPWQPCRLHCRAMRDGQPVVGALVMLRRYPRLSFRKLGTTDRNGRLDVFWKPEVGVTFELHTPMNSPLGQYLERTDLPAGGQVEVDIEVVTGTLVLRYPPEFELPEAAWLRTAVTITGGDLAGRKFGLAAALVQPLERVPDQDLGEVVTGTYAIQIEVPGAATRGTGPAGNEQRRTLEGTAEVLAGRQTICTLESTAQ